MPSCFSSHKVKRPFHNLFSARVGFWVFWFLGVFFAFLYLKKIKKPISLFKMIPKDSANMPSSVP